MKTSLFLVYLTADSDQEEIELCMQRIKSRNRIGEDKINQDYVRKIQAGYLELMSKANSLPYVQKVIKINQDFCHNQNIWQRLSELLF